MIHKPLPTQERLRYLFYYNEETGNFYARFTSKHGNRKVGQLGTITASNARKRWVDGEPYLEHRLIWVYVNGEDPGDLEIDHKDRNPLNNRISNLRLATHKQNGANQAGVGATWHKNIGRWIAQIRVNGTMIHLGTFKDKDEAIACYKEARVKHFVEFA